VQERLDGRQLRGQEAAVGPDGVAAQGDGPGLGDVFPQEGEGDVSRLLQGGGGPLDGREEPAAGVHLPHHVVHGGERLGGLGDDEVRPLGHDLEVVVRHQRGDLHDHVAGRVEPGHLQVEPRQHGSMIAPRSCTEEVPGS